MAFQLLFADDSATMHRVVQITLAREDAQVLGVSSGRDAVLRARERQPDIAVLDINMPEMDGYSACQALKDDPATGHIPVLLLASSQEPLDAQRAQDCGADGHLLKPFDTQGFIDKIKQTLSQAAERAASAPVAVPAPAPAQTARPPQQAMQPPQQTHAPAAPAHAAWTVAATHTPQSAPAVSTAEAGHQTPHAQAHAHAAQIAPTGFPAAQPASARPHAPQAPAQTRPAPSGGPFAGTVTPALGTSRQPQAPAVPHAHLAHTAPSAPQHVARPAAQPAAAASLAPTAHPTAAPTANAWKVPTGAATATAPAARPAGPSSAARVPLTASVHAQGQVAPAPSPTPRMQTAQPPAGGTPALGNMAQRIASAVAPAAAQAVQRAQPAAGGLDTQELMAAAKEILERVAWEVVPPMAEAMIKEHIERLARR